MPITQARETNTFTDQIEGTIGNFDTPAGKVIFLQTKATLSYAPKDSNNVRLTSKLTPAREALEVSEMDFNQLLQRDLDDHRIAHELVPYIMRKQHHGPGFFPSIVTALLPFQNRIPTKFFPAIEMDDQFRDVMFENHLWCSYHAPSHFRLQKLLGEDGSPDCFNQAILRWNNDRAKLVIMDGQHRAMALLAIHRTLTKSWGEANLASARYAPFYEAKITELAQKLKAQDAPSLDGMDFPVTICLFPEYTGKKKSPHQAARKLFIDVNKEAKLPSESRLILLSDTRLEHILAREMLNRVRDDQWSKKLTLSSIEYDNPEPRTSQPRRWNAVTNLEIILKAVEFCCFGPDDVISRVDVKVSAKPGLPNIPKRDAYFRKQMDLENILSTQFDDGPRQIERTEIGTHTFPVYNHDARRKILDCFYERWGEGILRLFSEVEPYRCHLKAAHEMAADWVSVEVYHSLAEEALFKGVGMFWTLEKGADYWKEQVNLARDLKKPPPPESDVVRGWRLVQGEKRAEFFKRRAKLYLDKDTDDDVKSANDAYDMLLTYAAQIGLSVLWATIRARNPVSDPMKIVNTMIVGINRSLTTGPVQSRDRRLILSKLVKDPFNQLPRLDSSFASFFRVFWLELLLMDHNHDDLRGCGVSVDDLKSLLDEGRSYYINLIIDEHKKSLRNTNPDWSDEKISKDSRASALKALAKGYAKWMGGIIAEWHDALDRVSAEPAEDRLEYVQDDEDDNEPLDEDHQI